MKNKFIFFLLLMIKFTAVNADEGMRWSIKGFGTFSVAGTDTDEVGFYRSITQTKYLTDSWGVTTDSRLGLQVDVDINRSFHATIQWVARDHIGNFFEQNLDWAFLRWNISDTTNIRVGRLGADLFLLSDYRNVGYAYPWIRPPHAFYAGFPVYHFDGFDLSHQIYFNDDVLSLKFFTGYSFTQLNSHSIAGVVDLGSPVVGGSIKFESGSWTTRAGYSYLRIITEFPNEQLLDILNNPLVNLAIPGINKLSPLFSIKDTNIHYYSLGAAYDDGTWLAQAELSYVDTETVYFPDTLNAYLSVGRRFSNVTLYTLFGISHSFQKDIFVPSPVFPSPQLEQLQQVVNTIVNKNGIDEKSISLGARWDVYPNIALKTQWSHYWLSANGAYLWHDGSSLEKAIQVNVLSFGIDFIF